MNGLTHRNPVVNRDWKESDWILLVNPYYGFYANIACKLRLSPLALCAGDLTVSPWMGTSTKPLDPLDLRQTLHDTHRLPRPG